MDYQARLNDILTMLDQGEYLDDGGVESAQEDVTALFLESAKNLDQPYPEEVFAPIRKDEWTVIHSAMKATGTSMDRLSGELLRQGRRQVQDEIAGKWQTNQEDGE